MLRSLWGKERWFLAYFGRHAKTDIRNQSPVILGLGGASSPELRPSRHTPRPEMWFSGSTQWFLTHSPVMTPLREWGGFQTQYIRAFEFTLYLPFHFIPDSSLCPIVTHSTGFVNTFLSNKCCNYVTCIGLWTVGSYRHLCPVQQLGHLQMQRLPNPVEICSSSSYSFLIRVYIQSIHQSQGIVKSFLQNNWEMCE